MISVFGALSVYLVYLLNKQGEQTVYAFNQPLKAVTSSQNASNTFADATNLTQMVLAMTMHSESQSTLEEFKRVTTEVNRHLKEAARNSLTEESTLFSRSIEEKASYWFVEAEK